MSDVLAELGAHDWQNYVHYWRDSDAEWLQARSILRVTDTAGLATLPTPGVGQVVHVKDVNASQKNVLYMYSSTGAGPTTPGWVQYPAFPKMLYTTEDSTSRVTFGHHANNPAATVPALTLSPTGVDVLTDLRVRTSVFKVTAADVQIKTGTATAVLTTDATALVSSVPIKVPGITSTGGITAASQTISAGTVSAGTLTSTGGVNAVTVAATGAVTAASLSASGGLTVSGAKYSGNGSGAVIQGANWVAGKTQLLVYTDYVHFVDGTSYFDNQIAVRQNRSLNYYNASNVHIGYGGPVIYSATDPGAVPNGTIWVQP